MRTWIVVALLVGCRKDPAETDKGVTPPVATPPVTTPAPTTPTPPFEEVVVDCARPLDPPPVGQTCGVSGDPSTATHVLIEGDVLADDASYLTGGVLVERGDNGVVTCVGCDCADQAPAALLTVTCADAVVSPGLINSHDHIRYAYESPASWGDERYDHRHDWRTGARGHTELRASSTTTQEAVLYGELRMLLGGATSIAGSISSASGEGLMRNLDNADYNEGLGGWEVDYATFPLGDLDGNTSTSGCGDYFIDPDFVLDNRIYLPHIAEGIDDEANNEFRCLAGLEADGSDLVADNTSIIHGIGLDASDVAIVAQDGAHLVWSPRSNVSLYGETAPVVLYDNLGVPISLGTDWTPSGSATMLRELQCADSLNRDHYGGHFSDRDLWNMVTRNAAVTMGADGQLGRLREGYVADVAIFAKQGRDLHRAVIDASLSDVALVMRGSTPLTGESDLMSGLLTGADFGSCEALDDCVSDHVVCVDGGLTLADLQAAAGAGAYDLTICQAPADEPTCVPLRDDEDGDGLIYPVSSLDDLDEDGVEDAADNCPDIFNPGKPLDGFTQGDVDSDGVGDACDRCPLDDANACTWLDPDQDGWPGLEDNCPGDANEDQIDSDGDLIGDACDPCPDFRSATGACPESVYDFKQGLLTEGQSVVLEDMLVTAIGDSGIYLQQDAASPLYAGVDYSGLYVYMPSVDPPARGDVITIQGTVNDFFGQLQLDSVAGYTVLSSGVALVPEQVEPADVATGGSQQWTLEGVLIQVQDVDVTALDLPPGGGDSSPTNEFEIAGSLRVDDQLYLVEPAPVLGENFASITGVLRYASDDTKIEPRDTLDVLAGDATIDEITPESALLLAGTQVTDLLTVVLARPAGLDEIVSIGCTPAQVVSCPASVTVLAGTQEADIAVTGLMASLNTAMVTASLNGSMAVATVDVYDDTLPRSVVALSPDPLGIAPDGIAPMTVTLDLPAPGAGATVALSSTGLVTVPASVIVAAGDLEATFDVTAGPTMGVDIVTATLGTSSVDATIDVDPAAVGIGLLFSEYLEGSVGNNKFLEIKNVDAADIDLGTCAVQVYSNGALSAGTVINLDPVILSNGDLWLLCHNATTFSTYTPCDQSTGSLTFNGNDTVELICDGVPQDVIGEIGFDPGDSWGVAPEITKDGVLRRDCGIVQGDPDGSDPFDPVVEWIGGTLDDASDLGLDSCP